MSQSYMTFPHFIFFSICRKLFGWYVRVCAPGRAGGEERGEGVQEGESAWQQQTQGLGIHAIAAERGRCCQAATPSRRRALRRPDLNAKCRGLD